ncbi:MAG: glycoside hydrolase family 5 protein, partial [Chloroflexi bacterium]|nr:glycoside hydrolase family 5 protein [Chloroflexota bacterium]
MPSLKNRFIIIAATSLAIFMLMLTAWFLRNHVTLAAPKGSNEVYLPLIAKKHPWVSPFGTETQYTYFPNSTIFTRAEELGVSWIRLNGMISWRALQPNEGDPIDWSMLSDFEDGLRTLKAAGIIPIVIADDYPAWATIEPNSCGAIRTDKFAAYADFVAQLADRYKTDEFNVHHWELGNEPDVDPSLVITNNVWGCWGDIDDPYYGGEHYGEMLKVMTPAVKAANSNAKVWIGGLLLDSPNSEETNPGRGRPELFLQGILEAGAAPYFDIVAFHFYVPYTSFRQDHDNGGGGGRWDEMGGGVLGKTSFLRNIMQQYGVTKPLFLNEMG